MWASEAILTLERSESFLYTTPFMMEKYATVMKRQVKTFDIDITRVTAGIGLDFYGNLFAVLLFLFIVCWLNELWQAPHGRNSMWQIILSMFPCNGELLKHQHGVT